MEPSQAVRLAKWKIAQQHCIDCAKNTGVRADADSEGGDGEVRVPRTGGHKPKSVLEILKHFTET